MAQGESSRDKTFWEIQKFLYDHGSATSKEIYANCTCAKATFYKYLNELCEADNIIWKPQRGKGEDLYELPKRAFDKIEEEIMKQKLKQEIDSLPVRQIRSLYEFIDKILMKCVALTVNEAFLESLLQGLREGKISKEQICEIERKYAEEKKTLFTKRPYFFTRQELDQMSQAILAGEELEVMNNKRILWFEKWFGTII